MVDQLNNYYMSLPPKGKGPGVLVLHAWWGLNDFFRDTCDRLAQAGFVALAPDLFSRKIAYTIEEAEQIVKHLDEAQDVEPKILPSLEELRRHSADDGNKLGVVGFSYGAPWALWLAEHQPESIRAVTLFYGTNGGSGDFKRSTAAFQGHFAENDPFEPADVVKMMENHLIEAHRPTKFYTYPGTGHWFAEADRPDAYNPAAARLAWERTIAFLHEQLDDGEG